jgi:hypothetical protein
VTVAGIFIAGPEDAFITWAATRGLKATVSGGKVVLRRGKDVIKEAEARGLAQEFNKAVAKKPIDGTRPQHGTPSHDATSYNKAKAWEKDPSTVEARFNQDLVDANGRHIAQFRPDAQRIRTTPDGRKVVDVVEVRSPSQTPAEMDAKIAKIRRELGDQAGEIKWVEPTDVKRK